MYCMLHSTHIACLVLPVSGRGGELCMLLSYELCCIDLAKILPIFNQTVIWITKYFGTFTTRNGPYFYSFFLQQTSAIFMHPMCYCIIGKAVWMFSCGLFVLQCMVVHGDWRVALTLGLLPPSYDIMCLTLTVCTIL